jgi:hypothetical protein
MLDPCEIAHYGLGMIKRATAMSWVYFVRYGSQIKIGRALNPAKRFYALKGGSPVPLKFLGCMPGGKDEEEALHRQFADQRRRKRPEWFTSTPELLAFIKANARPAPPAYRGVEQDMRLRENR